ncbi:MAG: DUF721 domain-containing protein, partial [Candidatus Acidiferrum sp.]
QPARTGLMNILTEALRNAPPEEAPLLAWPAVCGAAVAGRTRALAFEKGTLKIAVPDATWRAQLSAMAGQYCAALNRLCPHPAERIEFVVEMREPSAETGS